MNTPRWSPTPFERLTLDHTRPAIMGIVNVTPDSFSDGARWTGADTTQQVIDHAQALIAAGASIIDIGGESSRPGATPVDEEEEIRRVLPVIKALAALKPEAAISIDTVKPKVAALALAAGAEIVNDITALGDPAMASIVAEHQAVVILMHMRGSPSTMQQGNLDYTDASAEVGAFLARKADAAQEAGVLEERIWIDPGLGFGKRIAHNLELTCAAGAIQEMAPYPLVYGASRKAFLGSVCMRDVADRDRATAAACALAVAAGADILRVHDIDAIKDAVALASSIRRYGVLRLQPLSKRTQRKKVSLPS